MQQAEYISCKLLTIGEAASLLNVKESKLRSAIFKREIPFVKIGRLVRFKLDELMHWIDSQILPVQRMPSGNCAVG